jgi:homogentisate 1,2-dioxygenase
MTPGYLSGFGNGFETEALDGACRSAAIRRSAAPTGFMPSSSPARPSPRRAPPTSAPGSIASARRCKHWGRFRKADIGLWRTAPAVEVEAPPAPYRWSPLPLPSEPVSFLQGVRTITTAGDANATAGMSASIYLVTRSMVDECFYNADGELLFVPEHRAGCGWRPNSA